MAEEFGKETRVFEHHVESGHSDNRSGRGQVEHNEYVGYEDPYRAALEDNPEKAEKLTWSVALSAFFLGTSFPGPIIFGFIIVTPILVQLAEELGGSNVSFWIPSGWSAAAAAGFSVAGRLLVPSVSLALVGSLC